MMASPATGAHGGPTSPRRGPRPHRRVKWSPRSASSPSSGGFAAPYDEHAGPVHVTASGIVVGRRGTVLHRHKKLGIWMQPGGHIDAGERPADAACARPPRSSGSRSVHPAAGSLLLHLDVHEAAHRSHTPRPALPAARRGRTRSPHRTRAPTPAGAVGTRRWRWPTPALSTRCPSRGPRTRRTMSDDLARLLAVQDLDTTITQLEHRRLRSPSRRADRRGGQLAELEARAGDAAARRGVLAATQKELEEQIAVVSQRRSVIEKRMYAATGSSGARPPGHERRGAAPDRAPGRARGARTGGHAGAGSHRRRARRCASERPLSRRRPKSSGAGGGGPGGDRWRAGEAIGARATEAALLPSALADRYETLRAHLKGTGRPAWSAATAAVPSRTVLGGGREDPRPASG